MNVESSRDQCLDAETLAAFADGRLKRNEIAAVLQHLERCPDCMSAIEISNEVLAADTPRSFRWWPAVAAAAVIVLLAGGVTLLRRNASPMTRLVALATAEQRDVEPRLSGEFAYAPYRGPVRDREEATSLRRDKLVGATAAIVEEANAKKSADAQHAAGVALLLIDRSDDAIARLRAAANASPNDANVWSDLAAAEYAAALRLGRGSLYPDALAHADRALRADAKSAAALFNRALILERMGLTREARDAWSHYLQVDGSSQWAAEARAHLARLPERTNQSLFRDEEPRLLAGDAQTVAAIVDRFRQQARTFAEAEYLGRWGEGSIAGAVRQPITPLQGERELSTARTIGNALVTLSGESLLHDAVAAIDRATPAQRKTLAEAHAIYRRGRIAYSRQQLADAESDLRRAATLFANGGSPMALVARYYAAATRFDQNDASGAGDELRVLHADAGKQPRYGALAAHVEWQLALCATFEGDWAGVAEWTERAAKRFERLGEKSNLAFMQAMHAGALLYLGKPDDGWAQWIAAFGVESAEGRGDRLQIALTESALVEQATGRTDSARALLALAESAARAIGTDAHLTVTLIRQSLLALTLGERDEAARHAREAMLVASRIADPALRARAVADANVAAGAVAVDSDPSRATQLLTQSIDHYTSTRKELFLPEAKLLRARALARSGNRDGALRDIDSALAEVETHRSRVTGPVTGTGVFDAATELYHDAIRLSLEANDIAAAFAYAERSRGSLSLHGEWHPIGAAELQRRLRGSGAAVLEVVALPDELIAFFVSEDEIRAHRDANASHALYERVIRPFASGIARARQLIVVAAPESFAELFDPISKRHLIEQLPVALAQSASALQWDAAPANARSVVAFALPSGESTAALPESDGELRDIEQAYARSKLIAPNEATLLALAHEAPRADVVHIAGHTERDAGTGNRALLFANGRVSWNTAASMAIGNPIVVLAACETLSVAQTPRAHALSVGGGFLAAGASAVIGTLAPIPDNDARAIFRTVHRELANGTSPVVAVQRAQLEALANHSPAWRSVTLLITRVSRI